MRSAGATEPAQPPSARSAPARYACDRIMVPPCLVCSYLPAPWSMHPECQRGRATLEPPVGKSSFIVVVTAIPRIGRDHLAAPVVADGDATVEDHVERTDVPGLRRTLGRREIRGRF